MQLNRPGAPCLTTTPSVKYVNDFSRTPPGTVTLRYSLDDCKVRKYQQAMLKTCGCFSEKIELPVDLYIPDVTQGCYNLPPNVVFSKYNLYTRTPNELYVWDNVTYNFTVEAIKYHVMEKIICHDELEKRLVREGLDFSDCPNLCNTYTYDMSTVSVSWPANLQQGVLTLSRYVKEALAKAKASNLSLIVLQRAQGIIDSAVSNNDTEALQKQFQILSVYPRLLKSQTYAQEWSYLTNTFFSDVGGTLGNTY